MYCPLLSPLHGRWPDKGQTFLSIMYLVPKCRWSAARTSLEAESINIRVEPLAHTDHCQWPRVDHSRAAPAVVTVVVQRRCVWLRSARRGVVSCDCSGINGDSVCGPPAGKAVRQTGDARKVAQMQLFAWQAAERGDISHMQVCRRVISHGAGLTGGSGPFPDGCCCVSGAAGWGHGVACRAVGSDHGILTGDSCSNGCEACGPVASEAGRPWCQYHLISHGRHPCCPHPGVGPHHLYWHRVAPPNHALSYRSAWRTVSCRRCWVLTRSYADPVGRAVAATWLAFAVADKVVMMRSRSLMS